MFTTNYPTALTLSDSYLTLKSEWRGLLSKPLNKPPQPPPLPPSQGRHSSPLICQHFNLEDECVVLCGGIQTKASLFMCVCVD